MKAPDRLRACVWIDHEFAEPTPARRSEALEPIQIPGRDCLTR